MKNHKASLLLLLIILISFFFRFYNFSEFHFWGGDEEVLTATIRHIIWDRSPTLLVQNANLGFGLGPFYHYFLTPFYFIFNFDLVAMQVVASILGVITTFLVYFGAKELGGRKLALLAGFLYASSFFISLFDRRLVHLTLDPVLCALTFFLLSKVVNKNYKYIPFLAIPIGFSFHADASLTVLVIAIFLTWIFLRLPIKNKYVGYGFIILGLFILPLVLAEIRYQDAVIKPVIKSLTEKSQAATTYQADFVNYKPHEFVEVLAKVIATKPNSFIEEHFFYTRESEKALFSPLPEILVVITFLIGFLLLLQKKVSNNKPIRVLWIMIGSFILGIIIYSYYLKSNFFQHFYMVFFPIFIILLSYSLIQIYHKTRLLFYLFIVLYFAVNMYSLLNSSIRYPLKAKIALVEKSLADLKGKQFSIHVSDDSYIHGGGWTELYTLKKQPAIKSYWYDFWGWIYAAYSLYPGPVLQEDPKTVVVFYKNGDDIDISAKLINRYSYKDLNLDVLDNTENYLKRINNGSNLAP